MVVATISSLLVPFNPATSIVRVCPAYKAQNTSIGTPRQPGITPLSKGRIELSPYISYEAFDDLCTFSHIWILFVFHLNTNLNVLEKSKNDHGWTFPVFFFISYCDVTGKNKASKTEGQENGSLCHQNVSL